MAVQHERIMQGELFDAIKYMSNIRPYTISIEHGVKLSGNAVQRAIKANNLKKQGVRSGTADVLCFWQDVKSNNSIMWIELKHGKNTQQPNQVEFEQDANKAGNKYYVCYSVDDALDKLKEHCRLP